MLALMYDDPLALFSALKRTLNFSSATKTSPTTTAQDNCYFSISQLSIYIVYTVDIHSHDKLTDMKITLKLQ